MRTRTHPLIRTYLLFYSIYKKGRHRQNRLSIIFDNTGADIIKLQTLEYLID